MTDINFTSTYRIPITQAGVNSAKKLKLKQLIESYPNGLIGNSKVGNARISIPNKEDEKFLKQLKTIGYKIYQKFDGENIPKENIDAFIKENLDTRNYNQFGKNKKRMNRELREKVRYERSYTESTKAETQAQQLEEVVKKPLSKKEAEELRKADIRANNPSYLKMKEEEGEAFADAVFFGVNK